MYNERKADNCCYKCPDRKVTEDYNCHSHCERYLTYKADLEFSKAEIEAHTDVWIPGPHRKKVWRRMDEKL